MSPLLKWQQEFTRLLVQLFTFIHGNGYEFTLGDAYRSPDSPYGLPNSLHKLRLALDINLFKGEKYLQSTESHRIVGEYWESIGGSWGGRFNDGNHYSLEYRGVR